MIPTVRRLYGVFIVCLESAKRAHVSTVDLQSGSEWLQARSHALSLPQALIHGLNRHYYSISISYRKNELEEQMLMNLQKKTWTQGLAVGCVFMPTSIPCLVQCCADDTSCRRKLSSSTLCLILRPGSKLLLACCSCD